MVICRTRDNIIKDIAKPTLDAIESMESELLTLFKEYGLNEKEIKIYLYLVKNNKLTDYKIAKNTKINRCPFSQ